MTSPRPTGPYDLDALPEMYPIDEAQTQWEEEHINYIGPVILQYLEEHSHRIQGTRYASEMTINTFLTDTGLHENMMLQRINRESCQKWKAILQSQPKVRSRKAITIQILLKSFRFFFLVSG